MYMYMYMYITFMNCSATIMSIFMQCCTYKLPTHNTMEHYMYVCTVHKGTMHTCTTCITFAKDKENNA